MTKEEQALLERCGVSSVEELADMIAKMKNEKAAAEKTAEEKAAEAEALQQRLKAAETAAENAVRRAAVVAPAEERVLVTLPISEMNPTDTEVTVGVNGRFYKIKRGVPVEVPMSVMEVLRNSQNQANELLRLKAELAPKN